jgi:hypothetical protein
MTVEVQKAETIVRELNEKRAHSVNRKIELAEDLKRIGYAVHTGDASAKQKLAKLNAEAQTLDNDILTLDGALSEAAARLSAARETEALATSKANALLLREKVAKFKELGIELGEACADVVLGVTEMIDVLGETHDLGQPFPSSEQFRVNTTNAIKSLIQSLPQAWVRDFEFPLLNPSQRKDFGQLALSWSDTIERQIAARLGETNKTEAA